MPDPNSQSPFQTVSKPESQPVTVGERIASITQPIIPIGALPISPLPGTAHDQALGNIRHKIEGHKQTNPVTPTLSDYGVK